MLCENCKIREANIKYLEVINGVRTEHNLCSQCAKEMDIGHYSAIFDGEFPLAKLLSSLLGVEGSSQKQENLSQIICPTCKTSYQEFVEDSCFGCQDCYGMFDLLMSDKIKKLQGSERHNGKRPKYKGQGEAVLTADAGKTGDRPENAQEKAEQLKQLKAKLTEAVLKEDYESAAKYRDEIKSLSQEEHADG